MKNKMIFLALALSCFAHGAVYVARFIDPVNWMKITDEVVEGEKSLGEREENPMRLLNQERNDAKTFIGQWPEKSVQQPIVTIPRSVRRTESIAEVRLDRFGGTVLASFVVHVGLFYVLRRGRA